MLLTSDLSLGSGEHFGFWVFFVTVTKGRRVYLGLSLRRDAFHQSGTVWLLAIVSGVRKQIKAVPSLLAPVSFLFSLGPA